MSSVAEHRLDIKTYSDVLELDTRPVPETLRVRSPSADDTSPISVDRYISRDIHELEKQLLERLVMGPATATGIAVKFPVTRQAVVKHLGALEDAGMVAKERHGREVHYRLEIAPVAEATAWLTTLSARWEQRLLRLKRYVEEES